MFPRKSNGLLESSPVSSLSKEIKGIKKGNYIAYHLSKRKHQVMTDLSYKRYHVDVAKLFPRTSERCSDLTAGNFIISNHKSVDHQMDSIRVNNIPVRNF